MAVRLKQLPSGGWIATCVNISPEEPGDVYITDGQDHALRQKYVEDYVYEGLLPSNLKQCECGSCVNRPKQN